MLKSVCTYLCLSTLIVSCFTSLVPFIEKCNWDDKACLKKSSQNALSHFAAGIPALGLPSLDPLHVDKIVYDEGELHLIFRNIKLTGTAKCQVEDVERKLEESLLFKAYCNIIIDGDYSASGKLLFVPVEGDGPFHVKADKVLIAVTAKLTSVERNGVKYWNVGPYEHNFDVQEKAILKFENLFNGDKEKAAPIEKILDQNWRDLILLVGKPFVKEVADHVIDSLRKMTVKVPASDLEN